VKECFGAQSRDRLRQQFEQSLVLHAREASGRNAGISDSAGSCFIPAVASMDSAEQATWCDTQVVQSIQSSSSSSARTPYGPAAPRQANNDVPMDSVSDLVVAANGQCPCCFSLGVPTASISPLCVQLKRAWVPFLQPTCLLERKHDLLGSAYSV